MELSIELYIVLIFLSGLGFIFGLLGTVGAIYALIQLRTTHSVQLIPVDEEVDRANNEYMKKWATTEESIKEQSDLEKEDLEKEMPMFYEEDKEIISF